MLDWAEEHQAFRAKARDFVAAEVTPYVRSWEADGRVPNELFRSLGAAGFLKLRLSRRVGGDELDLWYMTILIEELVRCGSVGVAMSVLVHAEFATQVIDRAGTDEQRRLFVQPAAFGKMVGALALTEPGGGSDLAALRTTARREGDQLVINGAKRYIGNGNFADFITTAVRTGGPGIGGISLVVVPTDTPGFRRGPPLKKISGHSLDTSQLFFEDCRVPASYLVPPQNGGFRLIADGFETERLMLAVMATAHMRMLYDAARRYGAEREVFDSKLLGFQVWRHRLADVRTTIQAAQALTYGAIARYVAGKHDNLEISMAKLFATEQVLGVAKECAQMFGASALMEDTPIARLFRDSFGFTIGAGTSEMMREMIASAEGLRG